MSFRVPIQRWNDDIVVERSRYFDFGSISVSFGPITYRSVPNSESLLQPYSTLEDRRLMIWLPYNMAGRVCLSGCTWREAPLPPPPL